MKRSVWSTNSCNSDISDEKVGCRRNSRWLLQWLQINVKKTKFLDEWSKRPPARDAAVKLLQGVGCYKDSRSRTSIKKSQSSKSTCGRRCLRELIIPEMNQNDEVYFWGVTIDMFIDWMQFQAPDICRGAAWHVIKKVLPVAITDQWMAVQFQCVYTYISKKKTAQK